MSTSDRPRVRRVARAGVAPVIRLIAWAGAAVLAVVGILAVARGASPLVTLAAGAGVGVLWAIGQRSGGGEA